RRGRERGGPGCLAGQVDFGVHRFHQLAQTGDALLRRVAPGLGDQRLVVVIDYRGGAFQAFLQLGENVGFGAHWQLHGMRKVDNGASLIHRGGRWKIAGEFSTLPVLKVFFGQLVQRAGSRFRGAVVLRPGADVGRRQVAQTGGEEAEDPVQRRAGVEQAPAAPDHPFLFRILAALAAHDLVRIVWRLDVFLAQAAQERRDRDLHRADFATSAAQRRGAGVVRYLVQADHVRGDDLADGAWVDLAVGVTANAGVHRAMVHAGAAADAVERLAQLAVGEGLAAAVVQQDQVHLFRAIQLMRLARAGDHVDVGGDRLAEG